MPERKQASRSRQMGKAGERAFESALAPTNCVVQWVDTSNDIGRDAFVDLVSGTDVSGAVICVQIKSGDSFRVGDVWAIPGRAADFTLWRESTVPMFGVVHNPTDGSLRWVALSPERNGGAPDALPTIAMRFGKRGIVAPDENRLDLDASEFVAYALSSCRRMTGLPVAGLLSGDPPKVDAALRSTWVLARHDPMALRLVVAVLGALPSETLRSAVRVLAHATSHPDIYWTSDNWIPSEIRQGLVETTKWSGDDIFRLLGVIDENGIERGSIGQSVYHVLSIDAQIGSRLLEVALNPGRGSAAPGRDAVRYWAVCILCYHAGDDAGAVLRKLIAIAPDILQIDNVLKLWEHVEEWGSVDFF